MVRWVNGTQTQRELPTLKNRGCRILPRCHLSRSLDPEKVSISTTYNFDLAGRRAPWGDYESARKSTTLTVSPSKRPSIWMATRTCWRTHRKVQF